MPNLKNEYSQMFVETSRNKLLLLPKITLWKFRTNFCEMVSKNICELAR